MVFLWKAIEGKKQSCLFFLKLCFESLLIIGGMQFHYVMFHDNLFAGQLTSFSKIQLVFYYQAAFWLVELLLDYML